MHKLLLIGILIVTSLSLSAQTSIYHPFPDSIAVWGISSVCIDMGCGGDAGYIKNTYTGDTIIGAYTYKKIEEEFLITTFNSCCIPYNSSGNGFLREDTLNKKVYWRRYNWNYDTLLYDFSLSIGDTLKGYFENSLGGGVNDIIVLSIDSVLVGSTFRKRINFDTTNSCKYISIIEGVGSTSGLTAPYWGDFQGGSELQCFSINDFIQYSAPCTPDITPCGPLPVGNVYLDSNKEIICVFPNPFVDEFTIECYHKQLPMRYSIYCISGKRIITGFLLNTITVIELPYLKRGSYFLQLQPNNSSIQTNKMIKL